MLDPSVSIPTAANTPSSAFGGFLHIAFDTLWGPSADHVARHNIKTGNYVPAAVLGEVDRKIDDGLAGSGRFHFSERPTRRRGTPRASRGGWLHECRRPVGRVARTRGERELRGRDTAALVEEPINERNRWFWRAETCRTNYPRRLHRNRHQLPLLPDVASTHLRRIFGGTRCPQRCSRLDVKGRPASSMALPCHRAPANFGVLDNRTPQPRTLRRLY